MLSPDQVSWLQAYEDWWTVVCGDDFTEEHVLRARLRDAARSLSQDDRVEAMGLYKSSGNRIP